MTSYNEIYEIFAQKITDVKLMQLDDEEVEQLLYGYLLSSIAKFKKCKSDLSKRNNKLRTFQIDLEDIEKEILALMMVAEWLEPQINTTLLTSQFFGTQKEKLREVCYLSQLAAFGNIAVYSFVYAGKP